jgi:integrase
MNGIERRARNRRDGSRYDVWRVRWIDDAGRKRSATFDHERDARDFKAKLRILRRSGELTSLDAGRESLAEFAAQWWNLEAIPNLERSTLKTYSSHWNFHVLPRLGHLELRKVTPQVIAEFRAELEGDGVGREAIRRTLTMLQGMLARAVEWQQIQTNPVKAVRKPRTRRERAVVPLSPTEIERIRRHLLDEGRLRDATLVSVLAYAGLRPEEALALEWRHVRAKTLLVEQALSDGRLKGQKNRRPPRTVDLLQSLRKDLAEWRLACGRPRDTELVFPSAGSGPWMDHDYRNWRRRTYKVAAEAAGLESTRPYDLRHSFASLLIHEGRLSIVEIAAQLGHSPSMTLSTYAHVIAELKGTRRISADRQIMRARTPSEMDPKRTPQAKSPDGPHPRTAGNEEKPTPGFEPGTPSLRGTKWGRKGGQTRARPAHVRPAKLEPLWNG